MSNVPTVGGSGAYRWFEAFLFGLFFGIGFEIADAVIRFIVHILSQGHPVS